MTTETLTCARTIERIRARCEIDENGCWLWTGGKHPKGYGTIYAEGRKRYTHRAMYEAINGPLPVTILVCHRCDVPACANPDHLFAGTAKDNTADCIRKGRLYRGDHQKARTHCPSGHPYDEENTYVWRGRRSCRECSRACTRAWRRRQKA